MKGTGKKVLFISAVAAVTVGITYSTVMAVRSNNEALNKVAEALRLQKLQILRMVLMMGNMKAPLTVTVDLSLSASPSRMES